MSVLKGAKGDKMHVMRRAASLGKHHDVYVHRTTALRCTAAVATAAAVAAAAAARFFSVVRT